MKICFEALALDTGHRYRGIGNYVKGLLNELAKWDRKESIVQLRLKPGGEEQNDRPEIRAEHISYPRYWPTRWQWAFNELAIPKVLKESNVKLYHANSPEAVITRRNCKIVVTAYDLIPLIFPGDYLESLSWDKRLAFKRSLHNYKKADRIIAISEKTKSDFIKFLEIDPEKITVIFPGYNCDIYNEKQVEVGMPVKINNGRGYFIYVGGFDKRKNIEAILTAYKKIERQTEKKLVLIGRKTREQEAELYRRLTELGIRNMVIDPGHVSEKELASYYGSATALVYPSFYEGFGLPIIEAMACGCPVIASDAGALPEAAGEAGILVKADDTESISKAMFQLSINGIMREECRLKGIKQAKKFTWKKCADKVTCIYGEVLDEDRH